MRISPCAIAVVACVVLANVDTITSKDPGPALQAVINECDNTPAPGFCINRQPIHIWTFSSRTQSCQKIFGCYTFGDRNVFRNHVDCRDTCGKKSECDVSAKRRPSHTCNNIRAYWTFSRSLGRCREIVGCYWTSDKNVFRHKRACRKTCN